MESQSHTQEELISKRQQFFSSIKDNLNYIYIILMIIANVILSLLRVENGKIGLSYPNSGLGWALWITQVVLITFVGVMILNSFRRQGILQGHSTINATYQQYLNAITDRDDDVNPRSLKEYQRQQTIRDTFTKGSALVAINLLAMSLAISLNPNALIALVINILFSVCFGIKAMLDAEDYVITELVIWYKLRIKELEAKKQRRNKNGNKQP